MKTSEIQYDPELNEAIKKLPGKAGVYIFKNKESEVIYVGKALNLKKRVQSYFKGSDERYQIRFLLKNIAAIESIITDNEEQALILERDLINKYKPKFNIRLKDDKNYLSVRIDLSNPWPRLELVRRIVDDGAKYFGPFVSGLELRSVLEVINKAIPLRTCSDAILFNRQRPCLEYQIKRCAGPCCLPVNKNDYLNWIDQAITILKGKVEQIVPQLEAEMHLASEQMHYEQAALLRDRIEALKSFNSGQNLNSMGTESWDIFYIFREESNISVSIIFFRNGRISNGTSYILEGVQLEDTELAEAVISQFYENNNAPEEIIVNFPIKDEAFIQTGFKLKFGRKLAIVTPLKGIKFRLLCMAELNARHTFESNFNFYSNMQGLLSRAALKFKLRQIPRRIECVDISNLQGSNIVGAVVSYFDGLPDKQRYRKYILSNQEQPNDFAAIKEVVSKHLEGLKESEEYPDLLIIDGGKIQLDYALQAIDELRISIDIIALAKERKKNGITQKQERVFLVGAADAIDLSSEPKIMNFLAGIRDEVHRFVIAFHRSKRSKRFVSSILDTIPGVGQQRKKILLSKFGSAENIYAAGAQKVAESCRIPIETSEKILSFIGASLQKKSKK